jgi:hypothetical protein
LTPNILRRVLRTKLLELNALDDPKWFEKAKEALDSFRPLQLHGTEDQILEFLQYKKSRAGKWQTEGTLTFEPEK